MGSSSETTAGEYHVELPCVPASVAQARAGVRRWCVHAGFRSNLVADVQLAVSEVATNAVRHSGCSSFDVRACMDECWLVVAVADRGPGLEAANPGLGIGLEIVRGVSTSVDIERTAPGTRVTMRFDRRAA